jgi:hypothetical protein
MNQLKLTNTSFGEVKVNEYFIISDWIYKKLSKTKALAMGYQEQESQTIEDCRGVTLITELE